MNHLIKKLPLDIILRIIPYTYSLQSKTLLEDIVDFHQSKNILMNYYYAYWLRIEPDEYQNWLLNDLVRYANNYFPTMHGYTNKFYSIFRRNNFLQTTDKVNQYIYKIEQKEVSAQINIYLGLFTPMEREDKINIFWGVLTPLDREHIMHILYVKMQNDLRK
jgi:hypothetical protein